MTRRRELKREQAEARNLLTPPERRRNPNQRLLAEIFTEPEPIKAGEFEEIMELLKPNHNV